jgi:serine/threonine protein kinase
MGNCLAWLKSILPFQGTQHNIAGRRLREVRVLAEGGYGYIWRVQDTRTGNYYALKKMICQVLYAIIQSPETRRNFENEVETIVRSITKLANFG